MEIPDLAIVGFIIGIIIGVGASWFFIYFRKLREIAKKHGDK